MLNYWHVESFAISKHLNHRHGSDFNSMFLYLKRARFSITDYLNCSFAIWGCLQILHSIFSLLFRLLVVVLLYIFQFDFQGNKVNVSVCRNVGSMHRFIRSLTDNRGK